MKIEKQLDYRIECMRPEDAPAVARLHCNSIKTGLTTSLGQRFCERLYWGMARTPYSFVLVYQDEQERPLGFICCATNTSRMYRSILQRRFISLIASALTRFVRWSVIKSAWRAIGRPKAFKTGDFASWDLPEAELVSIGVSPEAQGKRVGTQLVEVALTRLAEMGCERVRVWTIEENEQATAFYQKRGFKLLGLRQHHGGNIRVFATDLTRREKSAH